MSGADEPSDAMQCADDLLALWREQRRLAHRAYLARLRAELIGVDVEEQELLAHEIAQWRQLVQAFARSRKAA